METLFKIAKGNPLISDIAEEIEAIWIELGKPDEPGGPSTDVRGVPGWLTEEEIEGLSDDRTDEELRRHNVAMELLLNLTGIWNAGGDIWLSRWERGSDEWQEYRERSYDIAVEFISSQLWDRFCDSM